MHVMSSIGCSRDNSSMHVQQSALQTWPAEALLHAVVFDQDTVDTYKNVVAHLHRHDTQMHTCTDMIRK